MAGNRIGKEKQEPRKQFLFAQPASSGSAMEIEHTQWQLQASLMGLFQELGSDQIGEERQELAG